MTAVATGFCDLWRRINSIALDVSPEPLGSIMLILESPQSNDTGKKPGRNDNRRPCGRRLLFLTVLAVGTVALVDIAAVGHPGVVAWVVGPVTIKAPLDVPVPIAIAVIGVV